MLNHPAAKKSNLFNINKNKNYVLQHKIKITDSHSPGFAVIRIFPYR